MKKKIIAMLTAVMVMGALAGCGDSSSKQESTPAAEPKTESVVSAESTESTEATTETTEATGGKGTLYVGTDATFQPFEYVENDEYTGFDIDLMKALAEEMGYDDVEFVNTDFKGLIPGLTAKKFDVIASGMYITDERKESINFTDTYYPGGLSIMVLKEDDSISTIEDLKDKKVAVQVGTKSVTYLEENYPDIKRVEVETNNEMFLSLESGKADAVITGRPAAKVYASQSDKVKVLDYAVTEELYGFGIRKEDTELLDAMNAALATIKENGVYDEIAAKYFGE
ncbi:MAG: transporter substrate-binding domain-containing protein [Lachnospiraceae bacterium]